MSPKKLLIIKSENLRKLGIINVLPTNDKRNAKKEII